jgi:hypothetical protein
MVNGIPGPIPGPSASGWFGIKIIAFSISHDHRTATMYGYYSAIEQRKTTFYRIPFVSSASRHSITKRSGRRTGSWEKKKRKGEKRKGKKRSTIFRCLSISRGPVQSSIN